MMWGNQKKVAKMTGIEYRTINHWVNHDKEFKALYEEAVEKSRIKFDAMTSALINDSLSLVDKKIKMEMDLIKNGESKMSPKDAALTTKILYEMRALSRSQPTSITERRSTEHLHTLAKEFEKITDEDGQAERTEALH